MSGQHKTHAAGASVSVDMTERSLICRGTLTDNIPYPTDQSRCDFQTDS